MLTGQHLALPMLPILVLRLDDLSRGCCADASSRPSSESGLDLPAAFLYWSMRSAAHAMHCRRFLYR